ncbi:MAG TPA: methyltransferase domain-containing protein [Actinospica sp.]|jgi:trans-aconitate 2-methyltransferase|nr:methyltransferase domain-containing protein [Actinospica sp.]
MPTQQQSTVWDPQRYLRFEQQRAQPFRDLLARIRADDEPAPATVADLGCGPGNATALLNRRWPGARVTGVDNSAQMIEAAARRTVPGHLRFRLGDLRELTADQLGGRVEVLITNATLQWVPGHLELLPRLVDLVAPGGTFALGVPGNFDSPSHTILAGLQRTPRWKDRLSGLEVRPAVPEPQDYLRALDAAGLAAEAWETTYQYVVDGENGVFDFVSSTALRPVLVELGGAESAAAAEFCDEYRAALREAYPATTLGGRRVQILPFRRVFAMGVR